MSALAYHQDFYGWTQEQAKLLREHRLNELDLENLLEEVESMGKSEKRELESRLEVLLMHLLKWHYQPNFQGKSWELTIREQRAKSIRHLKENPSLKGQLAETFMYAYEDARLWAARETGLSLDIFPDACPWTFEQAIDPVFFPEAE
ncbi:MAG: DUF29 domain-containing protein [Methylococcales bacterium]|nr:MAG: DUF29 domain-containing protein [Methylococcales bacterium]